MPPIGNIFKAGTKFNQPIPDIKTVDLFPLKLKDGSEVSRVSDEVAAKMDLSESIKVSVFADGEMRISDGHHRVAAARQLGIERLPVEIQAINATGEKLQQLIQDDLISKGSPIAAGSILVETLDDATAEFSERHTELEEAYQGQGCL